MVNSLMLIDPETPQSFEECGDGAIILSGIDRLRAIGLIKVHHYLHSVPSGKSHYVRFQSAIVVWSIPANSNIGKFLLGWPANVWELSRLWAPNGHGKNLLTQAISFATRVIKNLESPDALVSYADPNVGHSGGIYKAASWIADGRSEESRVYEDANGNKIARRAFHSGGISLSKSQIESAGFTQKNMPGKLRFVKPLTRQAIKAFAASKTKP